MVDCTKWLEVLVKRFHVISVVFVTDGAQFVVITQCEVE